MSERSTEAVQRGNQRHVSEDIGQRLEARDMSERSS
jgi:hypothetical protein